MTHFFKEKNRILSAQSIILKGPLQTFTIGAGFIILIFFLMFPLNAGVDRSALELSSQYPISLRWDNVEGVPFWIKGKKPRYHMARNLHLVSLSPGEEIMVRVPSFGMIRLKGVEHSLSLGDVRVQISNGSGLFVEISGKEEKKGKELLFTPQLKNTCIMRILRPSHLKNTIQPAIFISRTDTIKEILPYRELITLPGQATRLKTGFGRKGEKYWKLSPLTPLSVAVKGPNRFLLDHRFIYEKTDTARLQSYQINLHLNDRYYKTFYIHTSPESNTLTSMDGIYEVMGKQQNEYITLPKGMHRLSIRPSAPILFRLKTLHHPDYFFNEPDCNAPRLHRSDLLNQALENNKAPTFSDMSKEEILSIAKAPFQMPLLAHDIANEMIKDNFHKYGGLSGTMILFKAAQNRPDDLEISNAFQRIFNHYTFFRDLLPREKPYDLTLSCRYFNTPRLKRLQKINPMRVHGRMHDHESTRYIQWGHFLKLSQKGGGETITYLLSDKPFPGFLRIITASQEKVPLTFTLKMDDISSFKFTHMGAYDLKPANYYPSVGDIGRYLTHSPNGPLPHAPFLNHVGHFDLFLPPSVNKITIESTGNHQSPLFIALKTLSEKPYQLSPKDLLDIIERAPFKTSLFERLAAGIRNYPNTPSKQQISLPTSEWEYSLKHIDHHLIPLIRRVASFADRFHHTAASPGPPRKERGVQSLLLTKKEIVRLGRKARRFEKQRQYLPALEIYSKIFYGAKGKAKAGAQFSRIDMLFQLGESFKAVQQLKTIWVQNPHASSRAKAFEALKKYYQRHSNHDGLLTLYSAALKQTPSISTAIDLTHVFFEAGYDQSALTLGLCLPKEKFPLKVLLQAALNTNASALFFVLLEKMQDPKQQTYFKALYELKEKNTDTAITLLKQAGPPYQSLIQNIKEQHHIMKEISSPQKKERINALFQLEKIKKEEKGPFRWKNGTAFFRDYERASTLYTPYLNQYARAAIASKNKPVTLSLQGPVALKVVVRPLYKQKETMEKNGWIRIENSISRYLYPVTRNLPVSHLRLSGDQTERVGQKITAEIFIDSGHHLITIHSTDFSLMVQPYYRKSMTENTLLPDLTPEWVTSYIYENENQDNGHGPKTTFFMGKNRLYLVGDKRKKLQHASFKRLLNISKKNNLYPDKTIQNANDEIDRLRIRQNAPSTESLSNLLREGMIKKVLHFKAHPTQKGAIEKMAALAFISENYPGYDASVLAISSALFNDHRAYCLPVLKSLLNRITQNAKWSKVTLIEKSAGIQYTDKKGWQPESPKLRVLKSLIPPIPSSGTVLSDEDAFGVFINLHTPKKIGLHLYLKDLSPHGGHPMKVQLQYDNQKKQKRKLTLQKPAYYFSRQMQPGEHAFKVQILSKYDNQFLVIVPDKDLLTQKAPMMESKRIFYAATHEEPLVFSIKGPQFFRVDQYSKGMTTLSYEMVGKGWHRLTKRPSKKEERALFRIFIQKRNDQKSFVSKSRFQPWTPKDIAPPLISKLDFGPPRKWQLSETFSLGGQEDGTYSLQASAARIAHSETEPTGEKDRFFGLHLHHRYFDEPKKIYFHTEAFTRIRSDNAPTLGLKEWIYLAPSIYPIQTTLFGSGFIQKPEHAHRSEWSFYGSLSGTTIRKINLKTNHSPTLTLSGRYLSLHNSHKKGLNKIDRDIFTNYKGEHLNGLRLSDRLTHHLFLDTRLYVGTSLTSNEISKGVSLDYLKINGGIKQLFGPIEASASHDYYAFLADGDRSDAYYRQKTRFEIIFNGFRENLHRFEMGLMVSHEWVKQKNTLGLFFTYHLGKGRAYRDFSSREIDFKGIKKRWVPLNPDNRMIYGSF